MYTLDLPLLLGNITRPTNRKIMIRDGDAFTIGFMSIPIQ